MIIRIAIPLVCVVLAGCADNTVTGQAPASPARTSRSLPPAPPEAVAWAKRFCTIVRDVQQGVWSAPTGHDVHTAGELRRKLGIQFGGALDALATGTRGLGELGSSPVAGGDAATRTLADKFSVAQRLADDGKARMDALPAGSSEVDIGSVMRSAWPGIVGASANPFDGVEVTDPMRAADSSRICYSINSWPR